MVFGTEHLERVCLVFEDLPELIHCYCQSVRGSGINKLTSQPPWDHCAMPGKIRARVIKEGVEMTVLVTFIWAIKSPPSGRIRRQPG